MRSSLWLVAAVVSLSACGHGGKRTDRPKARPGAAQAASAKGAVARAAASHFVEDMDVTVFQKGNIHTHSTNSDGKSSPREVYAWYRDHGYNFLALTDHNYFTQPEQFKSLERKNFVLVAGEEVTLHGGPAPVHVNSLCVHAQIGPGHHMHDMHNPATDHPSISEALEWAISRIRRAGGVALVNHPNFKWAFGVEALSAAHGAQLLEIWSGHPSVHADGDGQHPSEETIWDQAEAKGEHFGGVSVDDAHYLVTTPDKPGAGRGFIQVFSKETTAAAICDAMGKSKLYASSGAEFKRIQIAGNTFSVWPDESGARVDFIATGGQVLSSQQPKAGVPAIYSLTGHETSVRARVSSSRGRAWTQYYEVAK